MIQFSRWSIAGTALVTAGLTAGLMSPPPAVFATSTAPSDSGTAFPDTQNYWAQPFIERLTQQQILAGYPAKICCCVRRSIKGCAQ
ncbi:hypothetical protein [Leptolyngbya ohadii]|uniref:hypothetical protein n=1 Tax=Leptolyngbya ohadii TaxID=1962290 RepID=UPI000B59E4C6|nr:hypothetical protein [Leptolyngbya ohadii]